MRRFFLVLLFAGLWMGTVESAHAGGPWPQPSGRFFLILDYYRYHTTRGTRADGSAFDFPNDGRYRSHTVKAYAEYGLSDRWTWEGQLPFIWNEYTDASTTQTHAGLSDAEVAVRYAAVASAPVWLAPRVGVGVPWLYDAVDRPALGFDQHYLTAGVAAGGNGRVAGLDGWWAIDGRYRLHLGPTSDQLKGEGTAGVHLSSRWDVFAQVFATYSVEDDAAAAGSNPNVQPGYTVLTASASVAYRLSDTVSLVANASREVGGKRSGLGSILSAELWLRL